MYRRQKPSARGVLGAVLVGLAFAAGATRVSAQDLSALLQVLKDKGILTQEEYDRVMARQKMKDDSNGKEARPRAAQAPQQEVKGGFRDGFSFQSADKRHTLALRGRVELDYRQFGGDDGANADTFDLRRGYFSFEGKLYDDFEYRLRGNLSTLNGQATTVCTAGGPTSGTDSTPRCTQSAAVANTANTSLDEAWLSFNTGKSAQMKFGQFKMPFGLEQLQTDLFTDFMERSMGDVISPGKERGLQISGYPVEGISYAIAYSNGQGVNANDTNNTVDNKDLLARGTVNFPQLRGSRKLIAQLGASYTKGTIPVAAAVSGRTEARGITFFAPSAFTGADVDRTRYGVDTAVAYGPVKLQAEWMQANYAGLSAAGGGAIATRYDKHINAYYASLVWMVTGEHYADSYRNGLFARPRPLSNFSRSGGHGAWELGLRYSRFDAAEFETATSALAGTGVKPATSANEASAWTFGVKWLPNPNVRLMLNYIQTKFDTPVTVTNTGRAATTATLDAERAVTVRTQVDF